MDMLGKPLFCLAQMSSFYAPLNVCFRRVQQKIKENKASIWFYIVDTMQCSSCIVCEHHNGRTYTIERT